MSDSLRLYVLSSPGSSVHGILQASGLPCPPPGDLPRPEIKPVPPALQGSFTTEPPGSPQMYLCAPHHMPGEILKMDNVYGHWPYTAHIQAEKVA